MFGRKRLALESGAVEFTVPVPGKPPEIWNADLVVLKLIGEELEQLHRLPVVNESYQPSGEFLTALADRYKAEGCPHCTPSTAYQIWCAVHREYLAMNQRFEHRAARALK